MATTVQLLPMYLHIRLFSLGCHLTATLPIFRLGNSLFAAVRWKRPHNRCTKSSIPVEIATTSILDAYLSIF
jgi:hypothetical protein